MRFDGEIASALSQVFCASTQRYADVHRWGTVWQTSKINPERAMSTTITVMYENVEDATFDLDYYMSKHMPLVEAKFKPFGLKGWRVLKAVGTPSGEKPRYSIIATLEFDTADQFKAAVAAEGGPVFGDVPNFSNKTPVVVIGELVGAAQP